MGGTILLVTVATLSTISASKCQNWCKTGKDCISGCEKQSFVCSYPMWMCSLCKSRCIQCCIGKNLHSHRHDVRYSESADYDVGYPKYRGFSVFGDAKHPE